MPLWPKWFGKENKLAKYPLPPRDVAHDVRKSILKKLEVRLGMTRPANAASAADTPPHKPPPASG